MSAPFSFFPERASAVGEQIDDCFLFILAVCVVFSVLIAASVIYFAVKYRRRSPDQATPHIKGSLALELAWTFIPLVLALVIFIWSARVYVAIYQTTGDATEVYVVGKQWMWKLQHPGGQREINELHIPVGVPVKLTLTSEDVIHSFYVPAFRVKQDALPGRYTQLQFTATRTGTYRLFCAEYCGTNHSQMIGTVYVLDPARYQEWLVEQAEGSLALEGRKLFLQLRCYYCHGPQAQAYAPVLEGLYGKRVLLEGGRTVLADENYLRESILEPKAKVVAGFQPIMPTFKGQVSEEDLVKLLAYLKALRPGETPGWAQDDKPDAAEPARIPQP